jgi:hypothetical protein
MHHFAGKMYGSLSDLGIAVLHSNVEKLEGFVFTLGS